MPYYEFIWTDQIVAHLAEHAVTPQDFEYVVQTSQETGLSDSSGLPAVWGYTRDGRHIMAIYEAIDELTLLPVTAYPVPARRRKR